MKLRTPSIKNILHTVIAACGLFIITFGVASSQVTLIHVHGLAYSADGKQILIPSHDGLAIYNNGRWSKAPGPQHDYMGFVATKQHFYSSGHPAAGSGLTNPFGLIRSADGGRNWSKLGFEGESDFHVMAVGYDNNAIYVYNAAPNSRMDRPGIYYTVNDGLAWRRADASGLSSQLASLAVHPTDAKVVAAGTESGLFVSRDNGKNFTPLISGQRVLAAYFALDGAHLWASSIDGAPHLYRIDWMNGKQTEFRLPPLSRDAVAYIAQNPLKSSEFAIATFERSVFVSKDGAQNWIQIADRGRGLSSTR